MRIFALNVKTKTNTYSSSFLKDFGFFKAYTIQNFIDFLTIELRKAHTENYNGTIQEIPQKLENKEIRIYHYQSASKSIMVFVDDEYPYSAVIALIKQIQQLEEDETQTKLEKYIVEYQDPAKIDILLKIKEDLEQVIVTVHKSIDAVLERGTKLDDLVRESETLTASSKLFYQEAKKNNSCCSIM